MLSLANKMLIFVNGDLAKLIILLDTIDRNLRDEDLYQIICESQSMYEKLLSNEMVELSEELNQKKYKHISDDLLAVDGCQQIVQEEGIQSAENKNFEKYVETIDQNIGVEDSNHEYLSTESDSDDTEAVEISRQKNVECRNSDDEPRKSVNNLTGLDDSVNGDVVIVTDEESKVSTKFDKKRYKSIRTLFISNFISVRLITDFDYETMRNSSINSDCESIKAYLREKSDQLCSLVESRVLDGFNIMMRSEAVMIVSISELSDSWIEIINHYNDNLRVIFE